MKRRGLSKVERKIREHKLREWSSVRKDAEAEAVAVREAEWQAHRAEQRRVEAVRAEAEAKAAQLHREWLEAGVRRWVETAGGTKPVDGH